MNLPNKLTIFRIVLVPLIVFFLLFDIVSYRYLYSLIIFILASYTDYLDGKIARGGDMITNFGKFADPLADKCLVISAFICFIKFDLISSLAVVIIILREFMVTSVRLVAIKSGMVISANMWGKAKTLSQMLAAICIIASQAIKEVLPMLSYNEEYNSIALNVNNGVVWISVLLTCISGAIYIYSNRNFIENTG